MPIMPIYRFKCAKGEVLAFASMVISMDIFRKILPLIMAMAIFLPAGCLTVNAENPVKVADNADIFTDNEEKALEEIILDVIEKHDNQYDIAVLTEHRINNSITTYTDNYYDRGGYGCGPDGSGIMLCIDVDEREYCTTTKGKGITVFTDYGQDHIIDNIMPYMRDGDYETAFRVFAETAGELIDYYDEHGEAYDIIIPKHYGLKFVVSLAVGIITALIICMNLRSKLITVNPQTFAADYVRSGSFRVTGERDLYLYKTVNRTKIESSGGSGSSHGGSRGGSSVHRSSSGSTHGGTRGHF